MKIIVTGCKGQLGTEIIKQLRESASRYGKSPYGQHLKNVADGKLRY